MNSRNKNINKKKINIVKLQMSEAYDKLGRDTCAGGEKELPKSSSSPVDRDLRDYDTESRDYRNLMTSALRRMPRHETQFLVGTVRPSSTIIDSSDRVIRCESASKPDITSSPLASGHGGGGGGGGNDGDGGGESEPPDPVPVLSEEKQSSGEEPEKDGKIAEVIKSREAVTGFFGSDELNTHPPSDPRSSEKLDSDQRAQEVAIISSGAPANEAVAPSIIIRDSRDLEEWQRRAQYEFPYKNEEQYRAIVRASKLLKQGAEVSDSIALQVLEDAGLLGHQNYDKVYQEGIHGYSRVSEDAEENDFMRHFMERIDIDENSVIADLGCGVGNSSILFAKRGARVIAVDSSDLALNMLRNRIAGTDYEEKITIQNKTVKNYLSNPDHEVTDMYAESLFHLFPPRFLSMTIFPKANAILQRSGGYIGYSMKTIDSDSASREHNFRLTTGDGYNCSLHKGFGIFKIFPDEHMVEDLAKHALRPIDMGRDIVKGYDLPDDTEYFRYIISQAK